MEQQVTRAETDAVIPSLDNTNFTLFALFKGGTDFGTRSRGGHFQLIDDQ